VHTFPALTDASRAINGIQFDWVVEEGFSHMPAWHPAVERVIPSAMRRWRQSWIKTLLSGEWRRFTQTLRLNKYDAVIDAQGLIKSGLITRKALGPKHGLDRQSAREPMASNFYDQTYRIEKDQHAIHRTRQLFSQVLGYAIDDMPLQYGLSIAADAGVESNSLLFLHGTTWSSKRWPLSFWQQMAQQVIDSGYQVLLPAGNREERRFADTLAGDSKAISVLPEKSLSEIAGLVKAVAGVVSVDTGLAHLAAALEVPTVALYGPTDARLTGILGAQQQSLQAQIDCSPCLQRTCPKLESMDTAAPCTDRIHADEVWRKLQERL